MNKSKKDALDYHSFPTPGKIEVVSTKPCFTQKDLSLAYTPGVADPCLEIQAHPEDVYKYTSKGNLVAVVSNGTAVLGLGNIGAAAGKPVMEGKGILFKRFADIDVFDLEMASGNPDEIIRACQLLEPTFGGINLEDIKAPECFYIEETLKKTMKIPVFHDDQHGTAIISGAGLINALEIVGKDITAARLVVNGAGAAGFSCADHYVRLGVKRENIIMCDTKGVIYKGRTEGMNKYKEKFAIDTKLRTLEEAMKGADVFLGVSVADVVTPAMLLSMAKDPIVFAMANPKPEIDYDLAVATRSDLLMASGRSDYPNQINNVLGFPFIFRGALDVRATQINDEMKLAATYALAELAKEDVPDSVRKAYGGQKLQFGREYIIPKPFDSRVLIWEAAAVAEAAIKTGVAQKPVDIAEYRLQLEKRLGRAREVMRTVISKAQRGSKRIVFPEGEEEKILRASQELVDDKIARPILLGNEARIKALIKEFGMSLDGIEIIDPGTSPRKAAYIGEYCKMRERKGATLHRSEEIISTNKNAFGAMMVHMGDADALVSGLTDHYAQTIRPSLRVIKMQEGVKKVSGLYMLVMKKEIYFLADTTVNIDPDSEDLAEIALLAAETARRFDVEPRIAMLSFSNFGGTAHPLAEKVSRAVEIVRKKAPGLMIDGEMQADTAVIPEIIETTYPFSTLKGGANVLIFPNLEAGNIAYKLLSRLGGATAIGPILMGMSKAVHVLQRDAEVNDIVNMAAIAAVDAQQKAKADAKKPLIRAAV
ncbi:MAG: NADP-dependent malic enzyme [Elusimicrobia bacterium CG_4_10_14_0_2_um_filter_56_8]|nr:MAG: phosphate acetyltransferase [Elusimicrobia bacterium CG1_02_56_21]PJA15508.1 MAG: NADP-dependent malic enzyme [Elusimicrobia bacterium CG_4_10_14_0_2_um_filter_56_8]